MHLLFYPIFKTVPSQFLPKMYNLWIEDLKVERLDFGYTYNQHFETSNFINVVSK